MKREIIATKSAPAAIGPYAQANRAGVFLFTAGQIGLDPATGTMQSGIENQTRQVLANLQAILQAAGSDLSQVVKTTIFLADLADFATVNRIYGGAFHDAPPARSTVQVAALPAGALLEIDAIAIVPGA